MKIRVVLVASILAHIALSSALADADSNSVLDSTSANALAAFVTAGTTGSDPTIRPKEVEQARRAWARQYVGISKTQEDEQIAADAKKKFPGVSPNERTTETGDKGAGTPDVNAILGSAGYALETGAFWFPKESTGTGGLLAKYNLTQLKTNLVGNSGATTAAAGAAAKSPTLLDGLGVTETSLGLGTTLKAVGNKKNSTTQTPWMFLVGFGFGSFTADNSNADAPRYAARVKVNIGYAHFHGAYPHHDQLVLGVSADYAWLSKVMTAVSPLLGGSKPAATSGK